MATSTRTVRINEEFYEHAESVAGITNRSASGQIEYWAKLGEAVEASNIGTKTVVSLLAGRNFYDLPPEEQGMAHTLLWRELTELNGTVDPTLVEEGERVGNN
ncbi:MAG: hypothetical protein COA46_06060 [Porticoccaceae bacterium]|nr:MAG: hypothetical protein COA46_06060 [Porticoccaceae bacterium]